MSVILSNFVETSQKILDIPAYYLEQEYEFCASKISSD